MSMEASLSDREFEQFRRFIYDAAGISLSEGKKALVGGRLARRVQVNGLRNYGEYYDLISGGGNPKELQTAVDLLTTNETYFFREPQHFEFLARVIVPEARPGRPLRVWSAACSSGEEVYSIAMVLAEKLGAAPWELLGSDISLRVLERARMGHYPLDRAKLLPPDYLGRFCLKGTEEQAGTLLVERSLRQRVKFFQANLNEPLPDIGQFDLIFLRNVMIYFDADTKRSVMRRIVTALRPGGWFFVSHSENLHGITDALEQVQPAVFRKP
jgi:chemotaxis protein methyltransferase CheR